MATATIGWRLILAALFVGACAVATIVIVPIHTGQVGFDTAASVVYFDRITGGRTLEASLTATPKPLVTLLAGVLHTVTDDWRPISWATIAAFASAAVLAAVLVRRLAGALPGIAAGVAVVAATTLLSDVALSYAVAWALVGWLLAGLAITSSRPRYGLAGVALGVAALARFETLLVVALAGLVLVLGLVPALRRRGLAPPRDAWLVLLALLAIPIQALHDLLLTGDPLYSYSVPVAASAGAPLVGPLGVVQMLGARYAPLAPVVVVAVIGLAVLVRDRAWGILVGLVALGPGVAAFLVWLAARDVYVSSRYPLPIDTAVLLAAAIGLAGLRPSERLPVPRWLDGAGLAGDGLSPGRVVAAILIGIAVAAPLTVVDRLWFSSIRSDLRLHLNADTVRPVLAGAVAETSGSIATGEPTLIGPVLLRPQLAVDLDLPLTIVGSIDGTGLPTGSGMTVGQVVYHDRQDDRAHPALAALEVTVPTRVGPWWYVPIAVDETAGYWVLRVSASPG